MPGLPIPTWTCERVDRWTTRRPVPASLRPGLFVLLMMLLAGCQEDVTAVLGTDRPFSMFGVLTPQADTQWVRVFSIDDRLAPIPPTPLDARFTSTDLTSNESLAWQDSLVREQDGMVTHVYWAPFQATFGHTYRLQAERSDGATSHVVVDVPPRTELALPAQMEQVPPLFPVRVVGAAPHLIRIEVTYRFKFVSSSGIEQQDATLSYDGRQRRVVDGWLIEINVAQDVRLLESLLRERVAFDPQVGLKIVRLTIRLIVANEAWQPPGGRFDPEILVQPGTLTNVENGFGFVGAGYRLEDRWVPLDTIIVGNARGF